jgi:hypothetical protein
VQNELSEISPTRRPLRDHASGDLGVWFAVKPGSILEWIKGHAAHPENEECRRMGIAARQRPDLPADTGFEDPGAANISLGLTLV